jgi:hypothetical protein
LDGGVYEVLTVDPGQGSGEGSAIGRILGLTPIRIYAPAVDREPCNSKEGDDAEYDQDQSLTAWVPMDWHIHGSCRGSALLVQQKARVGIRGCVLSAVVFDIESPTTGQIQ